MFRSTMFRAGVGRYQGQLCRRRRSGHSRSLVVLWNDNRRNLWEFNRSFLDSSSFCAAKAT